MQYCLRGSRQHCIRKILSNVVLILVGQHCTGQNPMQYCSRGSKQHCMKNLVQFRLNALGATLHRSKPYAMLPERLQTTLHKRKSCAMLSQYSLENIAQLKPYAMLPERLQTTLHKKMFHSVLTAYAILVLCNVVTEAPSNISQENIQTIEGMSFEQYLVTLFIYVNIRSFTSKKHKVISSSTFYQATGQTFSRTLSKKEKHFRQPCNVAETCAILTRGFRKVSGPRLHKQLTLNATIKPC